MVDLAGIPPFGGGGVNIRQTPDSPAPQVPVVEATLKGQSLSSRGSSNASQHESGHQGGHNPKPDSPQIHEPIDPNVLPGPPPAFQISLLELDRDLAQTLARLNATQAIQSDANAIAGIEETVPGDD